MTYKKRNECLKRLGFKDYASYLKSDLWKGIRQRVLKKKGKRCCVCKKPAFIVHHRAYFIDVLRGSNISFLEPICATCHNAIEYEPNGAKRSLRAVDEAFCRLTDKEPAFKSRRKQHPVGDFNAIATKVSKKKAFKRSFFSVCRQGTAPELSVDDVRLIYCSVDRAQFDVLRRLACSLFVELPWYMKVREFRYFKKHGHLRLQHLEPNDEWDELSQEFRQLAASF
jgi:hypothetical protein